MDPKKNYYRILEVHPQASPEMVERAKRLLLQRYHPDHNPTRLEWAAEQTRLVLEAYTVLSNESERATYDTARRAATAARARTDRPDSNRAEAGAQAPFARATAPRTPSQPQPRHRQRRATKPSGRQGDGNTRRAVACPHCGRVSRVRHGLDVTAVRCGTCGKSLGLTRRERAQRLLRRVDDRLERARAAILRFLLKRSGVDETPRRPTEKTSR